MSILNPAKFVPMGVKRAESWRDLDLLFYKSITRIVKSDEPIQTIQTNPEKVKETVEPEATSA